MKRKSESESKIKEKKQRHISDQSSLVDPEWKPNMGDILVLKHQLHVFHECPFVRVSDVKKNRKMFKVTPMNATMEKKTEKWKLGGIDTDSEIRIVTPDDDGLKPNFEDEFVCAFSRSKYEKCWQCKLTKDGKKYFKTDVVEYDPEVRYLI